jgi:threonine dehydrogenase-like Zn-dependent dehydrogenase
MKAAIITAPRQFEIQEIPIPQVRSDEVLIKVEGCGVSATDLAAWEGRSWFDYPLKPGAPGHEGWGRIAAVGDKVRGLFVGDRVTMLSYSAFAEYDVASARSVVRLPPVLNGEPFPGNPLACAINVCDRSGIEAGQTVAIIGIGFLGALLTALAVQEGAEVIAISRRPFAREMARRCGADHVLPFEDQGQVISQVMEITGGKGCECVIEAVGAAEPLDLAGELTCIRGRLVIAGYHEDGLRCVNMQLWNWRGLDVINAHEREDSVYVNGMRSAVAFAGSGNFNPTPFFTHTFRLEQLDEAMTMLEERPEGFLKALVDMT